MVRLLSMNEADCLDHQHRRASGSTNHHRPGRSAYRASGLVHRCVAVADVIRRTSRSAPGIQAPRGYPQAHVAKPLKPSGHVALAAAHPRWGIVPSLHQRQRSPAVATIPHDSVLISEVGPRDGLQSVGAHHAHRAQAGAGSTRCTPPACARSRSAPSCRPSCCRRWPTRPRWCATRCTLPGLTVMALVPNLRGAAGRARGRRAQAHDAGVGQRRALAGQRAQDARADGRRGARHRRAAPRARAAGAGSRSASPPPSAARCRARWPRTR